MKNFVIFFLTILSLNTFAADKKYEDTNFCSTLKKEITNFQTIDGKSKKVLIGVERNTFGFSLLEDFDSYIDIYPAKEQLKTDKGKIVFINYDERVLKRTKKNNVLVGMVENKIINDMPLGTEIFEINGKDVSEMKDQDIFSTIEGTKWGEKKLIEIKHYDKNGSHRTQIIKTVTAASTFYKLDLRESLILNINSKASTHQANVTIKNAFDLASNYKNYRLNNVIKNLFNSYKTENPGAFDDGFGCLYSGKSYREMGIEAPTLSFKNIADSESMGNAEENFNISGDFSDEGEVYVTQFLSVVGAKFKNDFAFQAFPFDSQALSYTVNTNITGRNYYPVVSRAPNFLRDINKSNISEWKHAGADYNYSHNIQKGYYSYSATFMHKYERNYTYYFFKIILPILIILIVSWSVFWIKPEELEARLTVSIVCLLSLIAYTFIIDQDIPKLAYLTFLDYVILISYFFSVIPTIQTVFVHQCLVEKNKSTEDVLQHDINFRKYVPLFYILATTGSFFMVVGGAPNIIKGLSFLH